MQAAEVFELIAKAKCRLTLVPPKKSLVRLLGPDRPLAPKALRVPSLGSSEPLSPAAKQGEISPNSG